MVLLCEVVDWHLYGHKQLARAMRDLDLDATRGYKYGPYAVLPGDCNYAPTSSSHPLPDFSEMRPYNVGSRTLLPQNNLTPGEGLEPDRRVARKLVQNGCVDVAWHLFEKTKDERLLAPTGTDDRIDQAWVTGPLADAVSDYRLLDRSPGASDHHGLVFTIDTDLISRDNLWEYR